LVFVPAIVIGSDRQFLPVAAGQAAEYVEKQRLEAARIQ
jgi:hypothetical protein